MRRGHRALLAVVLGGGLFAPAVRPARPLVWSPTPEELAQADAYGVAVTARGGVFPAPGIVRATDGPLTGEPLQAWALASDGAGNVYVGSGPEGRILRIGPTGKPALFFTVDDPLVTALAVTAEGDVLAGTAPGGKIYRIPRQGEGKLWTTTGERYVWSLVSAPDGTILAGTGEHGLVLRFTRSGAKEVFFDSDEAHVVTLAVARDGGLLVGGAGRGTVVRVDPQGRATALLQGDLPEVSALTQEPDGSVVAALVAPAVPDAKPPAIRIRLPDGARVGTSDENLDQIDERSGPEIQGYIEGLPPSSDAGRRRTRGRVVRIHPDGRSESLWSSEEETPFCVLGDGDGGVLFGTGEPARLYRIEPSGDVALLSTLPEGQASRLARFAGGALLATSNPASVYRVDRSRTDAGTLLAKPFDAGGPSRWGGIRWSFAGAPGTIELSTRTGNSRDPDATWSEWAAVSGDANRGRIASPDGRYLQWRARFPRAVDEASRLSAIRVFYEPFNRPPAVRDFALDAPEPAVGESATFRWEASDPDGDVVLVELEVRPVAGGDWSPVSWEPRAAPAASDGVSRAAGWRADRAVWVPTGLAEGTYEIRARATDAPANPPGESVQVSVGAPLVLIIDRTPPGLEATAAGPGRVRVLARDELSGVRRMEIVVDGSVRSSLRPTDGICDSTSETFDLVVPAGISAGSLRGTDAAGNRAEIPLPL